MGTDLILNDLYPGGAILSRDYTPGRYTLTLWHFAFNRGEAIRLVQVGVEGALDLAYSYWSAKLGRGEMPPSITDCEGKIFEREWYRLKLMGPDPGEEP